MHAKLTHRAFTAGEAAMSRPGLYLTRVLITSYFLLTATGAVEDPVIGVLIQGYLGEDAVQFTLTATVVVAALMVMMSRFVRQAALYLSVFVAWSVALYYGENWTPGAIGAIWREATLMAALVMVAFSASAPTPDQNAGQPAAPTVAPRRPAALGAPAKRTSRAEVMAPRRIRPAVPERSDAVPGTELLPPDRVRRAPDETNLFADLWDDEDDPSIRAA